MATTFPKVTTSPSLPAIGFTPPPAAAPAAQLTESVAPAPFAPPPPLAQVNARVQTLDALFARGEYAAIVRQVQDQLAPLSPKTFETLSAPELWGSVAELYILQRRLVGLVNHMTTSEHGATKLDALELLKRVGELTTGAFVRSVELLKQSDPNEVGAAQIYRHTLKKHGHHAPEQIRDYYLDKLWEFIAKGGDPAQMQPVSLGFFDGVRSGELCEFVVRADDDAAIIASVEKPVKPNHTLMALGGDVKTAGSLRVFKNAAGELESVVVGTFSGSYRPDGISLAHMVRHLVAAGVPVEKISMHEGEAAGHRALPDFLLALAGLKGAEAQQLVDSVVTNAGAWAVELPATETKDAPKPERVEMGPRPKAPSAAAAALTTATRRLRLAVRQALECGVIDKARALELAAAFNDALRAAEQAGNAKAYGDAFLQLAHLSQGRDGRLNDAAAATLALVHDTWAHHAFTDRSASVDRVFGGRAPKGRHARVVAKLPDDADAAALDKLIAAGMDVALIVANPDDTARQLALIAELRKVGAAKDVRTPVMVELTPPQAAPGRGQLAGVGADAELERFRTELRLAKHADVVAVRCTNGVADLMRVARELKKLEVSPALVAVVGNRVAYEQRAHLQEVAAALIVDGPALVKELGVARLPLAARELHGRGDLAGLPTIAVAPQLGEGDAAGAEAITSSVLDQNAEAVLVSGGSDAVATVSEIIRQAERAVVEDESERATSVAESA